MPHTSRLGGLTTPLPASSIRVQVSYPKKALYFLTVTDGTLSGAEAGDACKNRVGTTKSKMQQALSYSTSWTIPCTATGALLFYVFIL